MCKRKGTKPHSVSLWTRDPSMATGPAPIACTALSKNKHMNNSETLSAPLLPCDTTPLSLTFRSLQDPIALLGSIGTHTLSIQT